MASGHRKRKAALVRGYVLNPAGLTNVPESERGVVANQDNLVNLAAFASGGYSPTITATSTLGTVGSTKLGQDSLFSLLANQLGADLSTLVDMAPDAPVYMMPKVGQAQQAFTPAPVSSVFVVYSVDGPQSLYSPKYLTSGSEQTASLYFDMTSTGIDSRVKVSFYGAVNSSSVGSDNLRFYTGSATTTSNLFGNSNFVLTSSTNTFLSVSGAYATASGLRLVFSASAAQVSSTDLKGWVVIVESNDV